MCAEIRIPAWHVALDLLTSPKDIVTLFRQVMSQSPISQAELAEGLGVNPSTVSRWVNGKTQPSPDDMARALDLILERLDRTRRRAEIARDVMERVQRATELRGEGGDVEEQMENSRELRKLLDRAVSEESEP